MSRVQISCGTSPNSLRWKLGAFGGHTFDDLLFDVFKREVSEQDPHAQVRQTARVEDRGHDVEIVTTTVLNLAGLEIHPPGSGSHTILVEIKTTSGSKPRLPLSSFGKNYHQVRHLPYSHFVLVTNAAISPRSAREVSESFSAAGKPFLLIDEYLLWTLLAKHAVTDRLPQRPTLRPSPLVVETQILRTVHHDGVVIDLDVMLRNYAGKPRRVTIENLTDLSWRQSVPQVTRTIEPGRFEAFRLLARSARREASNLELRVVDHDGTEYPLKVAADDLTFEFKAPLVGERHHTCLNHLMCALTSNDTNRVLSVVGGAGRGKTRLIEDALGRTERATRKVIRAVADPERSDLATTAIVQGLERLASQRRRSGPVSGEAALLSSLAEFDHPIYSVVIVIEDLHHATTAFCQMVRDFVNMDRRGRSPLILVVSGRDDYSFPNDSYFALLDFLSHAEANVSDATGQRVTTFRVPDFSEEDSRTLIRAIVRDAPDYAVERIASVGEHVPFFIVQTIEYMLETGIAVLLSRESVGVPNPAVFDSQDGFPSAIRTVLSGRLSALDAVPTGAEVRHFLEVCSFFGQAIPPEAEPLLLRDVGADGAEALLVGRRFMRRADDGSLLWYHENIMHLLQELIHEEGRAVTLAREIASEPALFSHFEGWRAGRLLSDAERYADAAPYFQSIQTAADGMNNFSSVNVDPSCFEYVPAAFDTGLACDHAPIALIRLLLLHTYVAVHHRSGRHGPNTATRAASELSRVSAAPHELTEARALLSELRAHGLMDIGELGPATRIFLELEGQIKQPESALRRPDLLFDLYNRLQDVYRMHNHLEVSERYGELAAHAARQIGGQVEAVSMLNNAIVYHYVDTPRCVRLHEEALSFARSFGTPRHVAHIEVGLIVARMSQARGNITELKELMRWATQVLHDAVDNSYGAMLTRIYLLLATLAHLLAEQGQTSSAVVDKYIALGLNATIMYRSFDSWMVYNLKAVTAIRNGRPTSEIAAYFATALGQLRRSGLLFLGNLDLTFENIIVLSNVVRFLSVHGSEREKYSLAFEIRHYQDIDSAPTTFASDLSWARFRFSELDQQVRRNGLILDTIAPASVLFDGQSGYALCVTC